MLHTINIVIGVQNIKGSNLILINRISVEIVKPSGLFL